MWDTFRMANNNGMTQIYAGDESEGGDFAKHPIPPYGPHESHHSDSASTEELSSFLPVLRRSDVSTYRRSSAAPVDNQRVASHNSPSALSPNMAPITEEGE
jgi:hypothetical protein